MSSSSSTTSSNRFLEFCHYSRTDLKDEIGIDSYMNQTCECLGKVGEHEDEKLGNKPCSNPAGCNCLLTITELGTISVIVRKWHKQRKTKKRKTIMSLDDPYGMECLLTLCV